MECVVRSKQMENRLSGPHFLNYAYSVASVVYARALRDWPIGWQNKITHIYAHADVHVAITELYDAELRATLFAFSVRHQQHTPRRGRSRPAGPIWAACAHVRTTAQPHTHTHITQYRSFAYCAGAGRYVCVFCPLAHTTRAARTWDRWHSSNHAKKHTLIRLGACERGCVSCSIPPVGGYAVSGYAYSDDDVDWGIIANIYIQQIQTAK